MAGKTRAVRIHVPKKQLATAAQKRLSKTIGEAKTNRVATELFLEMCTPYVPIGSGREVDYGRKDAEPGALRESGKATEKLVIWGEGLPYAHYVYEGMVYGPNIPIVKFNYMTAKSEVVGWFTPKGTKKYPTGEPMHYYEWKPERHWDEAMLRHERRNYNYRLTVKLRKIAQGDNK